MRDILFAATRAPSGSNRQPFRFVVLTEGEDAEAAKALIARGAQAIWSSKRQADRYEHGSGRNSDSPKYRLARTMDDYVAGLHRVPVLILACLVRYRAPSPAEGASVYPACQNLLLAARALGYGGVMTGWQATVEQELRDLLGIPDGVALAATITLGRPAGGHGPVRRRPMAELVFAGRWGEPPGWALDPPGTAFTAAGPPAVRPQGLSTD